MRIASKVDRQAAFIIDENHLSLPGVTVDVEPVRQYAYGPLLAHVLGYVGRIPSEAADQYLEDESLGYAPDDRVGLAGVEYSLEDLLRGTKGRSTSRWTPLSVRSWLSPKSPPARATAPC